MNAIYKPSLDTLIDESVGSIYLQHLVHSRQEWVQHKVVASAFNRSGQVLQYVHKEQGFIYHDGQQHEETKKVCHRILEQMKADIRAAGRDHTEGVISDQEIEGAKFRLRDEDK